VVPIFERSGSTVRMTCLRNKRDSLALLDQKGFRPDIIIDIGAAGGTEGLYETWPQCRYVLVEPLSKFAPQLRAICSGLAQADYRIAAAHSVSPDGALCRGGRPKRSCGLAAR
jgi:16S rRNA G527 N7-methylase RsmG